MRRSRPRPRGPLLLAAPLALLTGACAFRPWTPSVSVAYWGEDAPLSQPRALPASSEVLAKWQLPWSITWSRYGKATLVSSLDSTHGEEQMPSVADLAVVQRAGDVGRHLAQTKLPEDVMLLVDMRGAASVAFGAELSRSVLAPIAPVLTFNNWPAEDELVPAEETLAALIAFTPALPSSAATKTRPVFLLDAWRLAYRFDEPEIGVHDNRYVLNAGDLPDVAMLQSQGISRVVYVVEDLDDAEVEEDDLHPILASYQAAGIHLSMVDLDTLASTTSLDAELLAHRLVVDDRDTLLDDPVFYTRAHGGFGGCHATPGHVTWGVYRGYAYGSGSSHGISIFGGGGSGYGGYGGGFGG
jgi:hypothetical protein